LAAQAQRIFQEEEISLRELGKEAIAKADLRHGNESVHKVASEILLQRLDNMGGVKIAELPSAIREALRRGCGSMIHDLMTASRANQNITPRVPIVGAPAQPSVAPIRDSNPPPKESRTGSTSTARAKFIEEEPAADPVAAQKYHLENLINFGYERRHHRLLNLRLPVTGKKIGIATKEEIEAASRYLGNHELRYGAAKQWYQRIADGVKKGKMMQDCYDDEELDNLLACKPEIPNLQ